jgi:hypothetical protein
VTDDPASPARALIVSNDPPRAAAIASEFDNVQLIAPSELGIRSADAAGFDCTLILADAIRTDVVAELVRHEPRAPLMLEASGISRNIASADLRGWRFQDLAEVARVQFVRLLPSSVEDIPELPRDVVDGVTRAAQPDDETPNELRRRIADLERQLAAAPAVRSTQPDSPLAPIAQRPRSRRSLKQPSVAVAVALLAVATSLTLAAVTGSGYVGAVVTLAALLGGCAAVLLAILQRRAAGRAARAEKKAREASATQARTVARLAGELRDQRRRLNSLQDVVNVVAASSLDTARTLAARQPNQSAFTDPAELAMMHQTQAIANLFRLVEPRGVIPPMGGWAASPDIVAVLVDDLLSHRPGLVVECGSGVSTLWLALVAQRFELPTRIVSLDHDPYFAALTRQALIQHGVDHLVEVRDAPLALIELAGHKTDWYETSAIDDLHDVGLLFVDGPPDATGPLARLPAVPLFRERLAARATVLLDDLVRPSEQEVAMRWQVLLADFHVDRLPLQKGAVRFRRG